MGTARGRVGEASINTAVKIARVQFEPRDSVIGVRSGVVFISAHYVGDVIAKAQGIVQQEAKLVERTRGGEPITQVMGADYERFVSRT